MTNPNTAPSAASPDIPDARDAALEQAACLVECEYAADATQGRRLAQIAQHIRDLKESALLDALQNNEGHVSGIAAYLAQTGGEAVAPEAKPEWPKGAFFTDGEGSFYDEQAEPLDHAFAPPAPPAPLPYPQNLTPAQADARQKLIGLGGGRVGLDDDYEPPAPLWRCSMSEKYDDVLVPFVAAMRKELHANSGKGDRPGWLAMDANTALLEVYWHAAKLSAAVKNNDGPAIQEHSADVANMAMMVLDICGGLAWVEVAADRAQRSGVSADPLPDDDAIFEKAMKQAFEMVNPFKPAGEPGSYARGEHNGIVGALQQLRANYEFHKKAAAAQSQPLVEPTADRIIEVFYQDGEDPLICAVQGNFTVEVLAEIERDLKANDGDYFAKGDGTYRFECSHFPGQYGFEGRCEIAPGWELDELSFAVFPEQHQVKKGEPS